MRRTGEVWESIFECERIRSLHKHERHGGAEEDDVGIFVLAEEFAFEVPGCSMSMTIRAREICKARTAVCRCCCTYSSQKDIL